MLRNNADARRCSYFELGLPVVTSSCVLLAPFGFFFSLTLKSKGNPTKNSKKIGCPVCTCLRSFPVEVYLLVVFRCLFSSYTNSCISKFGTGVLSRKGMVFIARGKLQNSDNLVQN